jgi:hypothetical protein
MDGPIRGLVGPLDPSACVRVLDPLAAILDPPADMQLIVDEAGALLRMSANGRCLPKTGHLAPGREPTCLPEKCAAGSDRQCI